MQQEITLSPANSERGAYVAVHDLQMVELVDPVLIVFLIVVGVGIAVTWWSRTRYATVSIGLNLRNGAKYAESLDALVSRSDFGTPDARAGVLHRIAALVSAVDAVDGFVQIRDPWSGRNQAGIRAEEVSRAHMGHIGIVPEIVNVAVPDGPGVKLSPQGTASDGEDPDGCVLAATVTVNRRYLPAFVPGEMDEAIETLRRLREFPGSGLDALYVYYSPNAGEPMDAAGANRLFLDMKATET